MAEVSYLAQPLSLFDLSFRYPLLRWYLLAIILFNIRNTVSGSSVVALQTPRT